MTPRVTFVWRSIFYAYIWFYCGPNAERKLAGLSCVYLLRQVQLRVLQTQRCTIYDFLNSYDRWIVFISMPNVNLLPQFIHFYTEVCLEYKPRSYLNLYMFINLNNFSAFFNFYFLSKKSKGNTLLNTVLEINLMILKNSTRIVGYIQGTQLKFTNKTFSTICINLIFFYNIKRGCVCFMTIPKRLKRI